MLIRRSTPLTPVALVLRFVIAAQPQETHMSKHTPGPWWHDDDGFVRADVGTSGDFVYSAPVADPHATKDIDPDEREANAHLIAAAPDLLAACEAVLPIIESLDSAKEEGDDDEPLAAQLRAAIAKAKGKA